jgi:aminoglycoside phosphotransferase (APT) family kinase protein
MARAGYDRQGWTVSPLPGVGLLNRHSLVEVTTGTRLVVRQYGWPWGPAEPFDRMAKEAWLLPRLRQAGVRAPQVLATDRVGADAALLLSFVDGSPLGELNVRPAALWHATGRALRAVHEADIGMAAQAAGLLIAGGVEPFDGGWSQWHVDNTRTHAESLARDRPELAVDVDRCVQIVEAARPLLDARPTRLIHTDANPWNVLVTERQAIWVDWEFAWLGDPIYDFARLLLARKRDLGPVPDTLFDGYGDNPTTSPVFAVYVLGFHLWMCNEAITPLLPLQTTYRNAEQFVRELSTHLDNLEHLVT